jgi:hypothetical protein
MKSHDVAQLLATLGVTKSHSRPHVSNDNPFSESQFKTLKYRPEFPDRFGSLEDALAFGRRFFTWYNDEHYHSGIAMLTPAMVHYGTATTVLDQRQRTLDAAYAAHPERFRAPSLYEASHILLPAAPEDAAARAAAGELAAAFIAEIARDPGAFTHLARDNSACDSRANGGRLGQIAAGDTVPEFEAALAILPVGGVTLEPVATRFGLHVIRLDARAEGALLPIEAVQPRIRDMLERATWARESRALVARLLTESRVSGVDFPAPQGALHYDPSPARPR